MVCGAGFLACPSGRLESLPHNIEKILFRQRIEFRIIRPEPKRGHRGMKAARFDLCQQSRAVEVRSSDTRRQC